MSESLISRWFWPWGEQRTLPRPRLVQPLLSYFPLDEYWISPNGALATPNVWACVRVLADAASSCPLIVYRRTPEGGRRRASGRTAELLRSPAEDVTQANLTSTLIAHLTLWGNAYVGKFRDEDGRVDQLLAIPPDQVQVERRAGRVRFTVTQDGRPSEHSLDDLIHIKALSTDGLVGLSPIAQMRQALQLDEATRTASTTLFTNNGRPSGILTMNTQASKDQAEALKEQWMGKHGGENAGGIAVVSGELTFTPLSMPADDAQFVEARKLSASEIARCFRIPPWMIGADSSDSMTYSNVESQALSFVVFSLRPWLTAIEQAFTADKDLFGPSTYCEFLIDSLLRADSKTRSEIYTAALDPVTGWMRRDEVRRLENLEPEPGGIEIPVLSTNGEGAIA